MSEDRPDIFQTQTGNVALSSHCETMLPFTHSSTSTCNDWPGCWTLEQKNDFTKKYDWLTIECKKLGCSICKKIGTVNIEKKSGMRISKEWVNNEVTSNGENRTQQLTSLRKKIFEHKESAGHKAACKLVAEAEKDTLPNILYKNMVLEKEITSNVFRTAYKVAKENQSFHNFETEIDLQELNGINMGRILHSANACTNIITHISSEMRKSLVTKIITSMSKISIIIDESTTLSKKSTLIIYIRVCLANHGMSSPVNLYLDLIELQSTNANGIFQALLECLQSYGITKQILRSYLVSVACDGAAVMLGRKSGVCKLLRDEFPSIIIWHCANHRLELAVADTLKAISGIHRFKAFIDKLYVIYHASPKNSRELHECARMLEIQLLKIGRVLSTRWVASSFRSVSAVWENFSALVRHFKEAENDPTRDKKDRCMYEGMHKKITSIEFILDLGLMCDALQELSELSLELQDRNINLYQADVKTKSLVQIFEERRIVPGTYYKHAVIASNNLTFEGIELHKNNKKNEPAIDPNTFYGELKRSIEERLITNDDDTKFINWTRILYPNNWPENAPLTFGEEEIRSLAQRLQINERESVRGFRDYLNHKTFPNNLMLLKNALNTIPISSSECERGFSQMNLILTSGRASLLTKTVSSLLFLRIVGPPLRHFHPTKYVESWIAKGHHSALTTQSKQRGRDAEHDANMQCVWNIL